MNRIFFLLVGFVFTASFVFALECGSEPTDGCSISVNTLFNPGTYKLVNGVRIANSDVVLDCNGAALEGYGSGSGVKVMQGQNNYTIKDCNIRNFSNGIHLYYKYNLNRYQKGGFIRGNTLFNNGNGIYSGGIAKGHITDTNITGNLIYGNDNGIYLDGNVLSNRIYENIFQDNKDSGIYIDRYASLNIIWNNDFYDTGIYYRHTNNYFCRDGIANNYYSGARGPECDCYIIYDGMDVDNYAKLCPRTYNLSNSIFVYGSSTLDCNGATLEGYGSGSGVKVMQGQNNYTIKNCNIRNFSNGIHLYYKYTLERYQRDGLIIGNTLFNNTKGIYSEGIDKGHITDANITGNWIYGNDNGIYLDGNVLNNNIHGNLFFANRDYNLRDNTPYNVSAEYNYWGTINIPEISEKIYDYYDNSYRGIVYFEPFLSNFTDLYVSSDDISFEKMEDSIRVNAVIHKDGYVDYVKVYFYHLDADGDLIENKSMLVDLYEMEKQVSAEFNLRENDLVEVIIEAEPNEVDTLNNFAEKGYYNFPFVYVSSYLFPFTVNDVVLGYVKDNLNYGYYTNDADKADVLVYIGKGNPKVNLLNLITLKNYGWGYKGNILVKEGQESFEPYSGLIGNFFFEGKRYLFIYGNRIEGDIAAIKRFIKNETEFTNMEGSYLIDKGDIDAIGVFDYIHKEENDGHYNKDNVEFGAIVRSALNDEMFTTKDKTTYADGIMLRLREIKPAYSEKYLEYKNNIELPVVLARGLWSNLTTWATFGGELANEGRDTWLIEITGGPGQDCDSCPNYDFDDLTDSYVPALLDKVLSETGKDRLQYVGFSNGCRAVLSSLEKGSFDPSKVETFVGVGCPGAFDGFNPIASGINLVGELITNNLEEKEKYHINIKDMFLAGIFNFNYFSRKEENKISLNLWKQYHSWMNFNNDSQPGNLDISNFMIIQGNGLGTSDGIVTTTDEKAIYDNINVIEPAINETNRKMYLNVFALHSSILFVDGLADKSRTKSLIQKGINKQSLDWWERNFNLKEEYKKER